MFVLATPPLCAQTANNQTGPTLTPHAVTFCELSKDPAAYNHELIRITAFVTHGFEDFHISQPDCPTQGFSVWVMYGGTARTNTQYCCPGEGGKAPRSETLEVEGIRIPLENDTQFQDFTRLLQVEPDTTLHFTAIGRFFSGEKQNINGRTVWGGAGHLGCCSLFVIQQVESLDDNTRSDLDHTAEAGWYEREGCKYGSLHYVKHVSVSFPDEQTIEAIDIQRKADSGAAIWAFNDPQRVAIESLKKLYPGEVPQLREVKNTSARHVFRWQRGNQQIVVVVARPYWLSFYAKSTAVAWINTMTKQVECTSRARTRNQTRP